MNNRTMASLEEAYDRTIILLWPPRPGIWFRIAIIALFLGGGMINPFGSHDIPETSIFSPGSIAPYDTILILVGTAILIGGFMYVVVSAIFQFIFVDCLSSDKIFLTRTIRIRWRKGVHLVGFYMLLLSAIIMAVIGVTLLLFIPLFMQGKPDLMHLLITLVEALVMLFFVLIPVWILAILAADFVVPVMIVDDAGVIGGWKRVFSLFQGNWREVGMYIGLKIILILISGIILGIILFLISILIGLTDIVLSMNTTIPPAFSSYDQVRIILGTGAMMLISLFLLVPVVTFFRYYSLVVLRDLGSVYNLLPDNEKTENL